jgi:hypothetical protein
MVVRYRNKTSQAADQQRTEQMKRASEKLAAKLKDDLKKKDASIKEL